MAKNKGNGMDEATELVLREVAPDPASLTTPITPELLQGVKVERIVTIEPGHAVCGLYLGEGAQVEVNDPVTGEVRELATHRFEVRPNIVARLIESHQLKRELPQYLNKQVRVMKLGLVDTRAGRRVNDYIVAPVIDLSTGEPRTNVPPAFPDADVVSDGTKSGTV